MISRIKITLESQINMEINIEEILLKKISREYTEHMKNLKHKPYSQHIIYDKNKEHYIWTISTLTEDSYNEIIKPLKQSKSIMVEHFELQIVKYEEEKKRYDDIIKKATAIKEKRDVVFDFATPTVFVINDENIYLPTAKLIYENVLDKWNYFSKDIEIKAPNLIETLGDSSKIFRFNIKSINAYVGNVKIGSFKGVITYKIKMLELYKIIYVLEKYSVYCGIGEYTYRGMGGINDK